MCSHFVADHASITHRLITCHGASVLIAVSRTVLLILVLMRRLMPMVMVGVVVTMTISGISRSLNLYQYYSSELLMTLVL